jgi:hypothetical protein
MSLDTSHQDRLACECLVVGSYNLMDQGLYEESAALFADDATWVRGEPPARTRAGILASLHQRPPANVTRHLISNVVVTLTGPNEATATGNFLAFRGKRIEGAAADLVGPVMVGDLTYHFRRESDGWKITLLEPKPVFAKAS